MIQFKGTKGKWGVGSGNMKDTGVDEMVIYPDKDVMLNGGYRLIAVISPISQVDNDDMANALLMSKSPEMLEMLQSCVNLLERMNPEKNSKCDFKIQEIKQLIKKAKTI